MFQTYSQQLDTILPAALTGSVVRTEGTTAAVADFPAPVGAVVEIQRQTGTSVRGEVIGFHENLTLVYPLGTISGIRHGSPVRLLCTSRFLRVGKSLLGRVVDADGIPLDGLPAPAVPHRMALDGNAPPAIKRPRIDTHLTTGIRAIDGFLCCGLGQRMGIFSGSGVGKSVMLGMMARNTSADVNVIGLIGERGREVNEFLERDLGSEALARSVVVVATSDQPALLRVRAAMTATSIAEYFRDLGNNVLLLMDSLTRFAMAQREIGLAAGEPPTTRGYPPSVFSMLPKLVERAGRTTKGSITAFYSVLVEGDDVNEPVSDAVRGLLDGHTILSRQLATRGHWPAVDILESISRLMNDITSKEHSDAATRLRKVMAAYRQHEDLISIGAYRQGSNPTVDTAIAMKDDIDRFLQQSIDDKAPFDTSIRDMIALADQCATQMNTNAGTLNPSPQPEA